MSTSFDFNLLVNEISGSERFMMKRNKDDVFEEIGVQIMKMMSRMMLNIVVESGGSVSLRTMVDILAETIGDREAERCREESVMERAGLSYDGVCFFVDWSKFV